MTCWRKMGSYRSKMLHFTCFQVLFS